MGIYCVYYTGQKVSYSGKITGCNGKSIHSFCTRMWFEYLPLQVYSLLKNEDVYAGLHTGCFPGGGEGGTFFFVSAEERVWLLGHTLT